MESKITAVLIEDEFKIREVFINLLTKFCPEIEIVGEADNISEGYDLIIEKKPQLVFLDIEMPGGNGFDLLDKFGFPPFETVFVTSHGHYAIQAIKFSALDYMLKPVLIDDVKQIATRYKTKVGHYAEQYSLLKQNLSNQKKKIFVNNKNKLEQLSLDEIVYLKADGNYTFIVATQNRKFHVAKTLKEYDEMLCSSASEQFIRVHKSYIVNADFIGHMENGTSLMLKDGEEIEVSRRKKQELLLKLGVLKNNSNE